MVEKFSIKDISQIDRKQMIILRQNFPKVPFDVGH